MDVRGCCILVNAVPIMQAEDFYFLSFHGKEEAESNDR